MEVRDFAVDADLAGWLRTRAGDTVLDGELVLDLTTQASMFVVFDAIVVDGERTGLFHSFARRLRCAEAWLDGALTAGLLPFDVIMKTQVPCEMLGEVRARLTAAEHGWVYEDGTCRHHSDGLIFTPANVSYYVCMPFKWKPTALMTVDFSVAMSDLANKQGPVTGNVKTFESFPPACDVVVDRSEPWVRELLTGSRSVASVILECLFVPEEGAWRAVKHRDDKNVPNSLRTAFSTLEAVAEGLTLDELVDSFELKAGARHSEKQGADAVDKLSSYTHLTLRALQGQGSKTRGDRSYIMQEQSVAAPERPPAVHSKAQTQTQTQDRREPPRPPTATTTTATTAAVSSQVVAAAPLVIEAEVGSHYDRIQRERWQGGKGSLDAEIAVLRKLQNWNKACMIKRLDSSQFDGRGDLEALLADLDVSFDVAGIAPMQAPLTGRLNAPNTQSRIPRRVLDLACGRGGDLVKWTRDCLINAYVGVDISAEELREAAQRAETLERGGDRPPSFHFHRSSCDAPSLLTELYALVNSRNPGSLDARAHRDQALSGFNVVWCQFALHYFCGSRESLDGFLKNVAGALGRGGRFCASFPNPSAIVGHLNHIAQTGEARSGSKVCYVSTDTPRSIGSEEALREFGLAYKFTLGDAVQDCVEFLVPLEALVSLASAVGLRLVRLQQMHAFMSRCAHDPELAALREVMQVVGPKSPGRLLSEHEWQAIGLYCVAVFERV
jgi:mRNA (guanine-N7-)-methyltransferase